MSSKGILDDSPTLNRSYCPACGLRCVSWIHRDCIECPDHGTISALLALQISGMEQWEAAIEIAAAQLQNQIRRAFEDARIWLYNDSRLKITAPYF